MNKYPIYLETIDVGVIFGIEYKALMFSGRILAKDLKAFERRHNARLPTAVELQALGLLGLYMEQPTYWAWLVPNVCLCVVDSDDLEQVDFDKDVEHSVIMLRTKSALSPRQVLTAVEDYEY